LQLNVYAKLHNHKDYIISTAFHDEIDVKLITSLYDNVKEYKDINVKYKNKTTNKLKNKLNLKSLEP
jgi:oligoendopeptidase F